MAAINGWGLKKELVTMEQQLRNLDAAPTTPTDWMKPDPYDPRIKPAKKGTDQERRKPTESTNNIAKKGK